MIKLLIECCNFRKSTAMRKSIFFSAVLSLFLLVPASIIWAQVTKTLNGIVRYESGMSKTTFTTPNGNVVVNLPQSMSGSVITGTVSTEPTGKTAKEKSRNLKELLKYVVNLNGTKIPLSVRPANFEWYISVDKVVRNPLELLNASGVKVAEVSLPPVLSAPTTVVWQPDRTPLLTTPSNIVVKGDALNVYTDQQFSPGEKFVLTDAKGQQFTLKPICLSSQQAVMNVPNEVTPGNCSVSRQVGNQPASSAGVANFNLIDISLSSPNTSLRPGELSNVQVVVNTGPIKPMWSYRPDYVDPGQPEQIIIYPCIDLRNLNPNTVTMEGGNLQRIYVNQYPDTKGNKEPATGVFQIRRNITGITPGPFSVSATLHEDYNTSNDPFRPQLNVLKTPEDFNAWANVLKKDLNQYGVSYDDQTGNYIRTHTQRAIDNMPVCTSPEQLNESKAVVYSLIQPLNVPKGAATMWLSGVEAYKAAIKDIPATISGNPQLINWDIIENGLYYFKQMGNKLGYDLRNQSDDAIRLIKQIQDEGQANEKLEKLNSALESLNVQANKAIGEMPAAMNMLLPGGILFATKFTPPGTTDLPVEVTEIWWTSYPTDVYFNCIAIAIHFTGEITLKQLSVRVNWVSKDGKKAGAADYIPKIKDFDVVNYHYCDTLRRYPSWPEDFTAATIVNTLPKDEIDLDKVKVTVSVNGKKVGEGKPGEGKPKDEKK